MYRGGHQPPRPRSPISQAWGGGSQAWGVSQDWGGGSRDDSEAWPDDQSEADSILGGRSGPRTPDEAVAALRQFLSDTSFCSIHSLRMSWDVAALGQLRQFLMDRPDLYVVHYRQHPSRPQEKMWLARRRNARDPPPTLQAPALTKEALKFMDTTGYTSVLDDSELRQFGCSPCQYLWWRRVPTRKTVAKCPSCRQKYDAIPRRKESGIGKFHCALCGNTWHSYDARADVLECCKRCVVQGRVPQPSAESASSFALTAEGREFARLAREGKAVTRSDGMSLPASIVPAPSKEAHDEIQRRRRQGNPPKRDGTCFRCGAFDHMARECPYVLKATTTGMPADAGPRSYSDVHVSTGSTLAMPTVAETNFNYEMERAPPTGVREYEVQGRGVREVPVTASVGRQR